MMVPADGDPRASVEGLAVWRPGRRQQGDLSWGVVDRLLFANL